MSDRYEPRAVADDPSGIVQQMPEVPQHGWLIHKAGRGWYRPKAQGYTSRVAEAGRYSHKDALSYSHPNGWDGPRDEITIKHESEVARRTTEADLRAEVERLRSAIHEWWIERIPTDDSEKALCAIAAEYYQWAPSDAALSPETDGGQA